MDEQPQLKNDIEVLKAGDFKTRVMWFHTEFSQDIENAVQTGQQLMYFWAAARTWFKAWLFHKIGRMARREELKQSAQAFVSVIWGTSDAAPKVWSDAKEMANDMAMCYQRLTGSIEESQFIETFSTDDNPKDFRSAICRTLKEFESEREEPDPQVTEKIEIHEC